MNACYKLGLITFSLIAITGLSACQSTQSTAPQNNEQHKHRADMKSMHGDKTKHSENGRHNSVGRQQILEQRQAACKNKSEGQAVEVSFKDKTQSGQCAMHFQANDPEQFKTQLKTHLQQQNIAQDNYRLSRSELQNMTAEQRTAYRTEKRQLDQEGHEQRMAQWQVIQAKCQGQAAGSVVQFKLGDQNIQGQCQLLFQPDRAAMQQKMTRHAAQAPAA